MSTNFDQRAKRQSHVVSNGNAKDMNSDAIQADYSYQGYNAGPMPPSAEPYYFPNMSFPFISQNMNDAAWSTGSDAVYPVNSYDYSMFGYPYPPQINWEYACGDFWSTAPPQTRKDYNEYYHHGPAEGIPTVDSYTVNGDIDMGMKTVDQAMKGMRIDNKHMDHPSAHMGGDLIINPRIHPSEHMRIAGPSMVLPSSLPHSSSKTSSWAKVASQPARSQSGIMRTYSPRTSSSSSKHSIDRGSWDFGRSGKGNSARLPPTDSASSRPRFNVSVSCNSASPTTNGHPSPVEDISNGYSSNVYNNSDSTSDPNYDSSSNALQKMEQYNIDVSQYNPKEFNLNMKGARFFIIKSYSEDDIHRSIKYSIWCSTEHGNKRLDSAFREREGKGPVYLLYSVNGSGHFCGVAQMQSTVDYGRSSSVWSQDKWRGQFQVSWLYIKDVHNMHLRHIKLENNENKPVTNSRDTQEVPLEKGKLILKIIHNFKHRTSIFDDFQHYERKQEDDTKKDRRQPRR